MDAHKFLDDKGDIIMTVSSSVPGLMIVPPGKTIEDAIPMTQTEFEQHSKERMKANAANPQINSIDDLTKMVKNLQAEVQKLKDKTK